MRCICACNLIVGGHSGPLKSQRRKSSRACRHAPSCPPAVRRLSRASWMKLDLCATRSRAQKGLRRSWITRPPPGAPHPKRQTPKRKERRGGKRSRMAVRMPAVVVDPRGCCRVVAHPCVGCRAGGCPSPPNLSVIMSLLHRWRFKLSSDQGPPAPQRRCRAHDDDLPQPAGTSHCNVDTEKNAPGPLR